jgi:hypothetical protein
MHEGVRARLGLMGFDIGEETVRVLGSGLPPLPAELEPSQTFPAALWRGERYGAVLFLRMWRNGNIDCDVAISKRNTDGSWEEPNAWGGGGWIDEPLVRSETGWDGDPMLLLGSFAQDELDDEDDESEWQADIDADAVADSPAPERFGHTRADVIHVPPEMSGEEARAFVEATMERERAAREAEWNQLAVRAVRGVAAMQVAAIEVEQDHRKWTIPIESPCGAFIVGLEHRGPATVRALDHHGEPLPDADGVTEHSAYG